MLKYESFFDSKSRAASRHSSTVAISGCPEQSRYNCRVLLPEISSLFLSCQNWFIKCYALFYLIKLCYNLNMMYMPNFLFIQIYSYLQMMYGYVTLKQRNGWLALHCQVNLKRLTQAKEVPFLSVILKEQPIVFPAMLE